MGAEYALWSSRAGSASTRDAQTRSMLEQLIEALADPGAIHPATAAMVTAQCRVLLDALPVTERDRLTVIDEVPPVLGRAHGVRLL
jgi:hypothetical protein